MTITQCEYTFDPLLENDRLKFSIYGTLDASIDTQRVRITPIRSSIQSSSEPVNATVNLKHTDGHPSATMKAYLIPFDPNLWAHNYKTDMEIVPGESYMLTVSRGTGEQSQTSVTIPDDYPDPHFRVECIDSPSYNPHVRNYIDTIHMTIQGVEHVVAFDIIYYFRLGSMLDAGLVQGNIRTRKVKHFMDISTNNAGDIYFTESDITGYLIQFQRILGGSGPPPAIYVDSLSVYMASAGPDWPDPDIAESTEITVPQEYTNVKNGVGVLAGIVSKTIPFENICN